MEVITEDSVLRQAKQYDVELVFEGRLSSLKALSIDPSAFVNCKSLTVLNLRKNKLDTLKGIELLAETLTYLNAAENKLTNITAVSGCLKLRHVFLEGNQLSNKASLTPLTKLAQLEILFLRREIQLDGELFVIDNPISADHRSYELLVAELFPAVRNVDGHFGRGRSGTDKYENPDANTSQRHQQRLQEMNEDALKDLNGSDVSALEKVINDATTLVNKK